VHLAIIIAAIHVCIGVLRQLCWQQFGLMRGKIHFILKSSRISSMKIWEVVENLIINIATGSKYLRGLIDERVLLQRRCLEHMSLRLY
jgi:hypothetical protein